MPYGQDPQPGARGLRVPGNVDLTNRPRVRNADGTVSTVRSMSFGTDRGEVLVPTVSDDGRIMTDEEAMAQYSSTGRHLGIFDNPESATEFAQHLHEQQASLLQDPQPVSAVVEAARRSAAEAAGREKLVHDVAFEAAPAKAARALTLSRQTGVPARDIEQDPTPAEVLAKRQAISMLRERGKNPITSRLMEDLWFAKAQQNDIDNLAETEGTFAFMGRHLRGGMLQNELGYRGLVEAFGDSPDNQARLRELDTELGRLDSGFIGGGLSVVGQLAGTLPAPLLAGAAATPLTSPLGGMIAAGSTAFGINTALSAGTAYHQMRLRGIPHDAAFTAAALSGIGQGTLETLADVVGAKAFGKAGSKLFGKAAAETVTDLTVARARTVFLKEYLTALGTEVGTETAQEVVQWAAEQSALRSAGHSTDDWSTLSERAADSFTQTLKSVALLAGAGPTANFFVDLRRAQRASKTAEYLERLGNQAKANTAADGAPSIYEAFLEESGRQHGAETSYVEGQQLAAVLQQADKAAAAAGTKSATDTLEERVPGTIDSLAEAVRTGGDVALPTAKIVRTELWDALRPHVRLDPDDVSFAQGEKIEGEAKKQAQQMSSQLEEQEGHSQRVFDEGQEVAANLRNQLLATKKFNRRDAEQLATVWRAVVEVNGERAGLTPAQFQAAYPLQVQADDGAPGLQAPTGRGNFDPATWRMSLREDADVSTVLHEFSHALLTMYGDMAGQKAHPTVVDDFDSFLKWAGVKDSETWRSMTLEQQRQHHEQFAGNWESWLFEGKAPTPELQPLFSRFLRILKVIYKVLTGQAGRDVLDAAHQRDFGTPLLELSDEMRGVFSRMLASDQQVQDMLAVRGAVPTFQSQKDATAAGMSADAWIEHQRQLQEADDAAFDDRTRGNLSDMRWLSGAKGKLLARLQAKEKSKRAAIRAQLAPAIENMPVHRARHWLQTGEFRAEDGTVSKTDADVPHKLRTDAVPEERRAALKGLLRKDGVDPDVVAEQFGFRSGESLVFDLATAPLAERAIETAVDQRMLRKHSLLSDPRQREAYMERALHSQARRRFVATELQALEKAVGSPRDVRAVAREAARITIANRTIGEISGRSFARAARRTSELAAEAMRKGDLQAAVAAKRQHLFNEEMASLAAEAREEVSRAHDDWGRIWRADEDIAKERELGVVSAARAILEAHGEVSHLRNGAAYLNKELRENDPELHAELDGIVAQATANAKPMRDMTLEQFREMRETVDGLWDRAKRDMEVEIGGRRVRRTEAVAALISQAEKTLGQAKAGPDVLAKTDRKGLENAAAVTLLKRVEHHLRMIDGGKRGAWTRAIFERLRQPFEKYMGDRERLVKQLHDRLKKLELNDAKIESTNDELGGHVFNGTAELIGAVQQMGNRSNLENMLAGNGWAERRADRSVDTSGWWKFIHRMVDEGKLTKEHLRFVQFVWDMNQKELRPIAQQANRELYGQYFKQVEAAPFKLAGETWAGGYVPSAVDLDHPRARHIPEKQKLAMLEDPDTRFRESMAHTGRGFTHTRQKVDLPRLMDVRLQVQHLDDVLRYVHLQPAVRDIASILRDRDFRGYANTVDPTLIKGLLTPWLERTARNRIGKPGMNRRLDEFFGFLRRTTGLNFMFGSLRNAAQQITGLGNALAYVPRGHLMHAAWEVLRDFWSGDLRSRIGEMSPFMKQRLDSKLGQMHDDIDALLDWSWRGSVRRFTNRHGYFMQSWMQDRVDQVVWLGKFNDAMEKAGDKNDVDAKENAIAEADSAVRRSQGSQTPVDVAAYEAGTPFMRLLTQFSGFFNVTLNQILEARDHRTRATMRSLVLPALGSAVIAAVLSGGDEWDDKDGNGNTDELAWWMFQTQVKAALGMVPGLGPAAAHFAADERPGDRLALAPAAALGEAVGRLVGRVRNAAGRELEGKGQTATSGTLTGTDLRDLATIISAATGIPLSPVARPMSYLRDQDLGRVEPATGPVDKVRGLLTGQGTRTR